MILNNSAYPDVMKALPNWSLWRLEPGKGHKLTKVPYQVYNGERASSTDKSTWTNFEAAKAALESSQARYNGLSFAFDGACGLLFIDVDHAVTEGVMNATAQDIFDALGSVSFVELSQSGSGLHFFTKGTIPRGFNNRALGVEMYSQGRFAATTGNIFQGCVSIGRDQAAVDYVFNKYKTHKAEPRVTFALAPTLAESEVIEKAANNPRTGETFRKLYSGDWSGFPSQSEADLRLSGILAFWCNRDFDMILSIIRGSGLYREKWDRADYQSRTIGEACAGCRECLSEFAERKQREEAQSYEKDFLHNW